MQVGGCGLCSPGLGTVPVPVACFCNLSLPCASWHPAPLPCCLLVLQCLPLLCFICCTPCCGLLLSLTTFHVCLSQTPAHTSLGLFHPSLLSASSIPCLSVQWHHLFLFTCLSSLPCQPCLSPSPSLSPSAFREGSGDL